MTQRQKKTKRMTTENWIYTYKCRFVDNYDGDSVTLDVDLGLKTWRLNEKARLFGVDTPELRGADKAFGAFVRDELERLITSSLESGYTMLCETHKDRDGKFGRLLVTLHLVHSEKVGINVNDWLVKNKYAVSYFGASKAEIKAQHRRNWALINLD